MDHQYQVSHTRAFAELSTLILASSSYSFLLSSPYNPHSKFNIHPMSSFGVLLPPRLFSFPAQIPPPHRPNSHSITPTPYNPKPNKHPSNPSCPSSLQIKHLFSTTALSKLTAQLYNVWLAQSPDSDNPLDVRLPHDVPVITPQKQPLPCRGVMLGIGMRGEDGVVGAERVGWRRREMMRVRVSGVKRRNMMRTDISTMLIWIEIYIVRTD